jgi:hypothetical protein
MLDGMNSPLWTCFAAILCLVTPASGQRDWQPAKGPLATRWATAVSPAKVHAEYPRPQLVRERWLNLNGIWEFKELKQDEQVEFGKSLPERILVPFPIESSLSGIGRRMQRAVYRREFEVPNDWTNPNPHSPSCRVVLHFGGVDWHAIVRVNGRRIDDHKGGYGALFIDITDSLRPSGPQELLVEVADPTDAGTQPRGKQVRDPKGIFYTPTTGIWQTVWLEPVPRPNLDGVVLVPDVESARLEVRPGRKDGAAEVLEIEAVVLDGDEEVSRVSANWRKDFFVQIPEPKLWSPGNPHLYELRLTLRHAMHPDLVADSVSSYFAMRKVSLGQDDHGVTRILLNNKPYFNLGLLDQGFWPDGIYTAPTDEALRYDIEQTKALGFNTIRKHVKVEPDRWYYWCDKLGVLVWQDMPSGDKSIGGDDPDITRTPESAAQYEAELRAMIAQLRNHPCIIMWVPFNEGWGQFDTARITKLVKDLDPTRLVNSASGWTDRGTGDILDIHAYPGPAAPKWESSRAAVLGEFGGLGLRIEGHTWSKESWGYQGMSDAEELTDRYVSLLRKVHELKEKAGLSAAIYTQTTDVETECNGLMTYDRAMVKMDAARVAAANRGEFPRLRIVVPTAQTDSALWRYTTALAPDAVAEWFKPAFDDSAWPRGASGFGTRGTPGSIIGTEWNTPEIWLRRPITLPREAAAARASLRLLIHHDEDCEVYLNGILAARLTGYTTEYVDVRITKEAAAALREGENLIAVHCRQTRGGQYVDAGLVEVTPR